MPHFIHIGAPPATSYLLDTYTAAAAWSTRKLRAAQTNCVELYESGGGTETTIGFSGDSIDQSAISSHSGANNGLITTWYDATGNGIDITQAASANKPRIWNGSSIVTVNSLPAIDFYWDNTNVSILGDTFARSQPFTVFIVVEADSVGSTNHIVNRDAGANNVGIRSGSYEANFGTLLRDTGTVSDATHYLLYALINGASSSIGINGSIVATGNAGSNGFSSINIGARNTGAAWFNGRMQEVIIFAGDQSANKSAIETNMANYWGITI